MAISRDGSGGGAKPAKKLSLIYILRILKRHSDPDHPLSQQEILAYLEEEYGMVLDRKAVKRNLMNLVDAGYPLGNKPWERRSATAEGGVEKVYGSWYYEHEFAPAELSALISSLLFSHLPRKQVRNLIGKLEDLQSEHFYNPATQVENIPNDNWLDDTAETSENKQMFYSLEVLNEAIAKRRKVMFNYMEYGPDKKQRPRVRPGRKRPHRYRVSPYAVVATNGRFYLIGNTDGHDDISHYRVDRLNEVRLLEDEPARPKTSIEELTRGKLNLPKHLAEHVNMFAGPAEHCCFRIHRSHLDSVMDAFGRHCRISEVKESTVVVNVKVNPKALFHWSLQFGPMIKVLAPQELAEQLRDASAEMAAMYADPEPGYYAESAAEKE